MILPWKRKKKNKTDKREGREASPERNKLKRLKKQISSQGTGEQVSINKLEKRSRCIRKSFPGQRNANVILRLAMSRRAYAELSSHAKETLDKEVCGVLIGKVCEDNEGIFVHIENVIRGASTRQGSTHVTFTQETWNKIHETLERDYHKMQILGWYHSHPGFGVEFSEMDFFIQKNFFSAPTQAALVIDPLGGHVAVCVNTHDGIRYIEKFWVDGREQQCHVSRGKSNENIKETIEPSNLLEKKWETVDARLSQVIQALDEQSASVFRLQMILGTVLCVFIVAMISFNIYRYFSTRYEPPELLQYTDIPVQIGDKEVLLGIGITGWQIPDNLNAILLQLEREKLEAAQKAAKERLEKKKHEAMEKTKEEQELSGTGIDK